MIVVMRVLRKGSFVFTTDKQIKWGINKDNLSFSDKIM
jgi:hypothetical protein